MPFRHIETDHVVSRSIVPCAPGGSWKYVAQVVEIMWLLHFVRNPGGLDYVGGNTA
jgi:hypothetical protein